MSRAVFTKPPPEANSDGVLWKLKKCVYGLVDAARHWYERVRQEVLYTGCLISRLDPCLNYFWHNGNLHGLLSSHVEDFRWSGDEQFEKSVIQKLLSVFDVRSVETAPFKYLGFDVYDNDDAIILDQSAYVREIKEIDISSKEICFEKARRSFRSLLGQLQWVATQTRPDICFDVNSLLACSQDWDTKHIIRVNKLVRKLHGTIKYCRLVSPKIGDPKSLKFNVLLVFKQLLMYSF